MSTRVFRPVPCHIDGVFTNHFCFEEIGMTPPPNERIHEKGTHRNKCPYCGEDIALGVCACNRRGKDDPTEAELAALARDRFDVAASDQAEIERRLRQPDGCERPACPMQFSGEAQYEAIKMPDVCGVCGLSAIVFAREPLHHTPKSAMGRPGGASRRQEAERGARGRKGKAVDG